MELKSMARTSRSEKAKTRGLSMEGMTVSYARTQSRRERFITSRYALPVLGIAALAAGCGTDWQQVLVQEGSAVGVTLVDRLLTEAANSLLDSLDEVGQPEPADEEPPDTGGDDGDGGGGGAVDFDSLTGVAAQGEVLFAEQGCMGCHCADATGGCVGEAPRVVGVAAEILDARLRGAATHPVKPSLTDQDIVDLEAYLASLSEP